MGFAAPAVTAPVWAFRRHPGAGSLQAPGPRMATAIRHLFAIGIVLASVLATVPARAALVIGCGQTFELATQKRDDIEQLVFDAALNEVVSVTVAAAAGQEPNFNPEFFLESPAGDRIFFADGTQLCANAIHQCETQPLPATGTYTINVRDAGRNQKGTFFLTLEAVSATAGGFSNGGPEGAGCHGPVCQRTNAAGKADGTQPVSVDAPAGGTIDSPGETDTFTFVVDADRVVTLQVAPLLPAAGPFDPRAVVFDPAGQSVGDVCLAGETCTFGPLVAGVHTVKIFDIDYTGTGDYTLLVADPLPSTTTTTITPTTISSPTTTTTTLPQGAGDLYSVWKTLRRQLPTGEALGTAIAADASRIVVGVPFDQTSGVPAGRAYVVDLAGLPPSPPDYRAPILASLEKPGGAGAGDLFGASVALLDGGVVAVGAPGADATTPSGTIDSGAVFLYPGGELRWQPARDAEFGATLTSQGSDLFVGAPGQGSGRVYRFVGGELSQVFGDAESDPGLRAVGGGVAGARFGSAIAVLQTQITNETRNQLVDRRAGRRHGSRLGVSARSHRRHLGGTAAPGRVERGSVRCRPRRRRRHPRDRCSGRGQGVPTPGRSGCGAVAARDHEPWNLAGAGGRRQGAGRRSQGGAQRRRAARQSCGAEERVPVVERDQRHVWGCAGRGRVAVLHRGPRRRHGECRRRRGVRASRCHGDADDRVAQA